MSRCRASSARINRLRTQAAGPVALWLLLAQLLGTSWGLASDTQGSRSSDYIELSLEELLNVRVTTPARRSQIVSEAPAIVSIVTRQQIESLGIQTLPELFSYVPGFNVYDNYWKPSMISARGAKMPLYNNKILLLLDGIPAYDAMALEYYLNLVPITSIERVEIIRGPGSTLYGTGAYSAVIHIITRDGGGLADGERTADLRLKAGSFATREAAIAANGRRGEFHFHLGAFARDDDGYVTHIVDEQSVVGPVVMEDDIHSLFARIGYRGFSLAAGVMDLQFGKFGPLPRHSTGSLGNERDGRTEHRKIFLQLRHEASHGERWQSKIYLRYDDSDMNAASGRIGLDVYQNFLGLIPSEVEVPVPVYYRQSGTVLQGEAQLSYEVSEQLRFLTGINAEQRRITHLGDLVDEPASSTLVYPGATQPYPITTSDYGAYAQIDGRRGRLGYVAGVRASYLDISRDFFFTPRLGLVWNVSPGRSLKLLYGEAFRGASPNEQFFALPGVIFGRDAVGDRLDPEQIRTAEIAWDQVLAENYQIRLNVFHNDLSDVIIRDLTTPEEREILAGRAGAGLGRIYRNAFEANLVGAEAEIFGYPRPDLSFFANVSYKEDRDDNYEFVENLTASAGFSFRHPKFSLHPNVVYVGEKSGTVRGEEALTLGDYTVWNLVAEMNLSDGLQLRVEGLNLSGEEYFYPEDVRQNLDRIPGGPGRAVYVSAIFHPSF